MTLEAVPIEYGYWHFEPEVKCAWDEIFPFANFVVFGSDWQQVRAAECVVPGL